jgi:hypothetical protein
MYKGALRVIWNHDGDCRQPGGLRSIIFETGPPGPEHVIRLSRKVDLMNRENKRKQYQKGYYRTHACDDSFTCKECDRPIVAAGAGSDHRNHCPNCLCSLHVDDEPGDRASDCGGIMDPVGVWVRKGGEWAVIHRCRRCGHLSSNRVAADDNPMKLMSIALKPLTEPPFPLDRIEELTKLMGGDGTMGAYGKR